MHRVFSIFLLSLTSLATLCSAQDSIVFKGQLSAWGLWNDNKTLPVHTGGRYIPQLNYIIPAGDGKQVDFEASVNLSGDCGIRPFDSLVAEGQIKPYRLWARYSSRQLEIRAGLQKINFGSASLLRPLMWFDQVDPRDPLKLTDGVWGIMGRYYFLNNANIWLWGLYGNKNPKGWEIAGTNIHFPEAGARVQLPLHSGEIGLSYHYRIADTRDINEFIPGFDKVPENRIGFDLKLDMIVGFWVEGTWVKAGRDLGTFTNQEILNTGLDYTFNIGNGLYVIYEHLLVSYDNDPFRFKNITTFSLLSLNYPVGLFDNLSGIVYYDWKNKNAYNIVSWKKQFDNITLYIMAHLNPDKGNLPEQQNNLTLFNGRGIQVMLVLNH